MEFIRRCICVLLLWVMSFFSHRAFACESCILSRYGEEGSSTVSGRTLKKNRFSAGVIFEYRKWNELDHRQAHLLHEEGRHIHNFSHDEYYHLFLGYGLSDDLELDIKAPFVRKSFLRVEEDVVGQGDSSSGIGDVILLGKYRFYKKANPVDISAIAGIKFPTGETDKRGFDGKKLELEEQPGTGSFDYLLGLALSKRIGRCALGADFIYSLKTRGAQGYEFGDVFRLDISSSRAMRQIGLFPNLRLTSELSAQFLKKDKSRGTKVFDSGGFILFLGPGIAFDANKSSTFFLSAPIPVSQNLGGEHPEVSYEVISGVVFNW